MPIRVREVDLRNTIREELISVLLERGNPWHSKDTGRFTKPKQGDTYSISQPKEKSTGLEAKKGIVTSTGSLSAKYGMPQSCGKKSISGEEIENPKYSCSQFKKKYSDTRNEVKEIATVDIADVQLMKGNVVCINITDLLDVINRTSSNELVEQQEEDKDIVKRCRSMGMQTFQELLNALNSAVAAGKGELYKQKNSK